MSLFPDGATSGPFKKITIPTQIVGDIVAASVDPAVVIHFSQREFLPYGLA